MAGSGETGSSGGEEAHWADIVEPMTTGMNYMYNYFNSSTPAHVGDAPVPPARSLFLFKNLVSGKVAQTPSSNYVVKLTTLIQRSWQLGMYTVLKMHNGWLYTLS